ncbi:MAG TPA: hypothetical protein PLO71_09280, partial [Thauera phenylacetica]|nr:hypothetical protein [Thauera phenylacetica]
MVPGERLFVCAFYPLTAHARRNTAGTRRAESGRQPESSAERKKTLSAAGDSPIISGFSHLPIRNIQMVVIRLARGGAKKRPFFNMV